VLLFVAMAGCELAYPIDEYQALDPHATAAAAGLIQEATSQDSSARELVVALPKEATVGDALVLVAVTNDTVPISVTSPGVTWSARSFSSKQVATSMWTAFAPPGGSSTVTVRWPASPAPLQTTAIVHLSEWRGFTRFGSEVRSSGTGGGPIATGSLTTDADTVLLLAAAAGHTDGIGPAENGFAPVTSVTRFDYRLDLAFLHSPAPGPHSTRWTYPSTRGWEALLVSFAR
jgi:hypothetical protein